MPYNTLAHRLFAAAYNLLDITLQARVTPYRALTAGRSHGRVLEIGGGTGANVPYYPDDAAIFTIEPNPHMARRFAANAARRGRSATIVAGVGETIPFADCTFDSVVTTLTLCMVKDLDAVIGEARRVLRPGGRFLFYEHVVSEDRRVSRLQAWANPLW